jgi:hypothetical protein
MYECGDVSICVGVGVGVGVGAPLESHWGALPENVADTVGDVVSVAENVCDAVYDDVVVGVTVTVRDDVYVAEVVTDVVYVAEKLADVVYVLDGVGDVVTVTEYVGVTVYVADGETEVVYVADVVGEVVYVAETVGDEVKVGDDVVLAVVLAVIERVTVNSENPKTPTKKDDACIHSNMLCAFAWMRVVAPVMVGDCEVAAVADPVAVTDAEDVRDDVADSADDEFNVHRHTCMYTATHMAPLNSNKRARGVLLLWFGAG